jgi:hypothetical protein
MGMPKQLMRSSGIGAAESARILIRQALSGNRDELAVAGSSLRPEALTKF